MPYIQAAEQSRQWCSVRLLEVASNVVITDKKHPYSSYQKAK